MRRWAMSPAALSRRARGVFAASAAARSPRLPQRQVTGRPGSTPLSDAVAGSSSAAARMKQLTQRLPGARAQGSRAGPGSPGGHQDAATRRAGGRPGSAEATFQGPPPGSVQGCAGQTAEGAAGKTTALCGRIAPASKALQFALSPLDLAASCSVRSTASNQPCAAQAGSASGRQPGGLRRQRAWHGGEAFGVADRCPGRQVTIHGAVSPARLTMGAPAVAQEPSRSGAVVQFRRSPLRRCLDENQAPLVVRTVKAPV